MHTRQNYIFFKNINRGMYFKHNRLIAQVYGRVCGMAIKKSE